ncbi:3-dehydroshikimate dehydratase [Histoplasma capsulatum]|uniref:3-dehydroshikimate dehydratase n=1 Tax=Ajellomyces capsulatus TaxID=5037 RepID=A0A8A1M6V5_AJECA|nr:3-dehydroshikimate dehydratase [Histoplasma capsulatum]
MTNRPRISSRSLTRARLDQRSSHKTLLASHHTFKGIESFYKTPSTMPGPPNPTIFSAGGDHGEAYDPDAGEFLGSGTGDGKVERREMRMLFMGI